MIEWLGHQIVFFPAVDLNDGSSRPNLIGAPEIRKIVGDANTGLLPKIKLVQWDNPLGLGTWSLDKPLDIFGTARAFGDSVTFFDDLKMIDGLLGISTAIDAQLKPIKDGIDDLREKVRPVKPAPEEPGVEVPGDGDGDTTGGDEDNAGSTGDEQGDNNGTGAGNAITTPESTQQRGTPNVDLGGSGVVDEPTLTDEVETTVEDEPAATEPTMSESAPTTNAEPEPEPELVSAGVGGSSGGELE